RPTWLFAPRAPGSFLPRPPEWGPRSLPHSERQAVLRNSQGPPSRPSRPALAKHGQQYRGLAEHRIPQKSDRDYMQRLGMFRGSLQLLFAKVRIHRDPGRRARIRGLAADVDLRSVPNRESEKDLTLERQAETGVVDIGTLTPPK